MDYDVFIIGTGTAGKTAAFMLKAQGLHVGIADHRPMGGTCSLRGCIPKKVLWGIADLAAKTEALDAISAGRIKWGDLIRFKQTFTDPVPGWNEEMFKDEGIDIYKNKARFTGTHELAIGGKTISAGKIVIAAGAVPRKLDIPGEGLIMVSDKFLDLRSLPQHIVFIGGGYISFEFANIVSACGRKATILHRSETVLKGFEPDIVNLLLQGMKKRNIEVCTDTPVTGIYRQGKDLVVKTEKKEFDCDLVVHGAGRVPEIEELGLAAGNISATAGGIAVNAYLQSISNPDVYAAGDVADSGLPLTPTAGMHGETVAKNIIGGNKVQVNHAATPTVVFSLPPMASVGLTEEQAKDRGFNFRVNFTENTDGVDSRRLGIKSSGYKVIIEKTGNKILGAHILGENADEVINIFALAMKEDITADSLTKVLWAFPTAISDVEDMAG